MVESRCSNPRTTHKGYTQMYIKDEWYNAIMKLQTRELIPSGCPKCKAPMPHANKICVFCGYVDKNQSKEV